MASARNPQLTMRDGQAARASTVMRKDAVTFAMAMPRRTRYGLGLDRDAQPRCSREPDAPSAGLDI
jgi:hypothetical protein